MNETRSQPPSAYGWYVVVVLTLAYIVSFIDRQILSLLIEPIRRELGLSDFQMSWIGPPAFATCFLVFGLVFGRLADRARRTRLVALGIAIWCVMTAACAFADGALEMFVARMGVGLGEAVLTPCALSLISDLFAREKVGKPIAFYTMGISLGSSIAFLVGGALVAWLEAGGHDPFAALGISAPWRETFLLVGLPGLVLVPLFLAMREPARRERLAAAGAPQASLRATWDFLYAQRRVFVPLFMGKAVFNLIAYAHFWIVPLFERTWGWSRALTAGRWGATLLFSGMTGVLLGGWLSDRWYRAGRKDAALRAVWLALLVTLPLHALAPLMQSGELALALFVPALIAAGAGSSAGSVAAMLATPNEYRGQMTALSLLIASGLGQFLGPTSVAFLTDFVFRDEQALRWSLSLAVLAFSLAAFTILSWGLRHYRAWVADLETRLQARRPAAPSPAPLA
jgi:MFS family permease